MFISLEALEKHPVEFEEHFPPGALELGPELNQNAPLWSKGRATLVEERHGHKNVIEDIRVVGEFSTTLEISCARCLEPVVRKVGKSFELLYRPQGSDAGEEEIAVSRVEAEIGYYRGEGLLLEDLLREQILLMVPIKTVCREDCRGLCPQCGRNLNDESCNCAEPMTDPRWDALRKLHQQES